jgi:hypothetical protein
VVDDENKNNYLILCIYNFVGVFLQRGGVAPQHGG